MFQSIFRSLKQRLLNGKHPGSIIIIYFANVYVEDRPIVFSERITTKTPLHVVLTKHKIHFKNVFYVTLSLARITNSDETEFTPHQLTLTVHLSLKTVM